MVELVLIPFLQQGGGGGGLQAQEHFYNIIHDNREFVFKPIKRILQLILTQRIPIFLFFLSFIVVPVLGTWISVER